mgnify:CR=1 FL=1
MKKILAILAAIALCVALGLRDASASPAPQIAVVVYPQGRFFTPEGVPELKGYLCLAVIGRSGKPEIHCAPAPRMI